MIQTDQPTIKQFRELSRTEKIAQIKRLMIPPTEANEYALYPLTDLQQSFVVGRYFDEQTDSCHIYFEFAVTQPDVVRLTAAWNALVATHPMLRTTFTDDMMQRTLKEHSPYTIVTHDMRAMSDDEIEANLLQVRSQMSHRVYDLESWPFFEIAVTQLPNQDGIIHFSIDEMIVDAVSVVTLLQQWYALYMDATYPLTTPQITFRQFVQHSEKSKRQAAFKQDLAYWVEQFSEGVRAPSLPQQVSASTQRTRLEGMVSAESWTRLKAVAKQHSLSPTVIPLTVFSALLAEWSADDDPFTLVLTSSNRPPIHPEIKQVVGPFTSTILLKAQRDSAETALATARHYQRQLWQALDHNRVSGIQILRELKQRNIVDDSTSLPIVFTSMLSNIDGESNEPSWFDHKRFAITQTPQVTLDHQVMERDGALLFNWDVVLDAFAPGIAQAMFADYCERLRQFADDATHWEQSISEPTTLPLTDVQQSYLMERANGKQAAIYQAFEIDNVDVQRLAEAWATVMARHPLLRSVVRSDHLLEIRPKYHLPTLKTVSLTDQTQLRDRLIEDGLNDQRVAGTVALLEDGNARLHLLLDTLVADGTSVALLFDQLMRCYAGEALHQPTTLATLQQHLSAPRPNCQADTAYWCERARQLPTGFPLREGKEKVCFSAELPTWSQLQADAEKHGVTANVVLLTAYARALQTHFDDAPHTIVVVRWDRPDGHETVVGDYTGLDWITTPDPTDSFLAQCRTVATQLAAGQQHTDATPIDGIRTALRRDSAYLPPHLPVVFTSLVSEDALSLPADWRLGDGETITPNVLLDNVSMNVDGVLHLRWDCHANRQSTLATLFDEYAQFLQRLSVDSTLWHEMTMPTDSPSATADTLQKRFEQTVATWPDRVALTYNDEQLTYARLNSRVNQLAHFLRRKGVKPEAKVGLCVDRSFDTLIGVLAILKAGGAYVPLDPAYPKARIQYQIEDASIDVVLTQAQYKQSLPAVETLVCLDTDWATIARESADNPPCLTTADNLAYIIYTSGSTGKPKGVLITHHNVMRLFDQTQPWYQFDEQDVWVLYHSYAFDVSVWEMWGTFLHGARLVIPSFATTRSFDEMYRLIVREGVTVLNQTPTAFWQLMEAEANLGVDPRLALRWIVFAGEALEIARLRPWFERHGDAQPRLINMYGITETTVHVTFRPITLADTENKESVIGVPIPDLELHILDEQRRKTPVGEIGELYVGGDGLGRGYLNLPRLTDERFIPDPFGTGSSERLYKSGDLVRPLHNGDIEYIGRIDFQVKIRGFRIELGEIENAVAAHPNVRAVVVLVQEKDSDDPKIVAYIVPHHAPAPNAADIRRLVRQSLPNYMVPNIVAPIEDIPLTVNGKLDRRALPWPVMSDEQIAVATTPPAKNADELSAELCDLFADLLRVPTLQPTDDLFDLGATSLTVVTLAKRIKATVGVDVPVSVFLDTPTAAAIGRFIIGQTTTAKAAPLPVPSLPRPDAAAIGRLLSPLQACEIDGEVKYRYPSAGGKYPVQTYLYVRQDGVDGLDGGLYYFHPEKRLLARLDTAPALQNALPKEANVALFFVAQLAALRPTYHDFSPLFAALDTGYVVQLLNGMRENHGLYLHPCAVPFETIRAPFALDDDQLLVACYSASLQETEADIIEQSGLSAEIMTTAKLSELYANMRYSTLSAAEQAAIARQKPHLRDINSLATVALPMSAPDVAACRARAARRVYAENRPIPQASFHDLLTALYATPIAAPLDSLLSCYVYVQENAVDGLESGCYRYRHNHTLERIASSPLTQLRSAYTPFNRPHLDTAGFTLYLVADVAALSATVGQESLHHALIEAGKIGQRLMERQPNCGVGLVPIGGVNFDKLRTAFDVPQHHILLHSFIGGAFAHGATQPNITSVKTNNSATETDIAIIGMDGTYPNSPTLDALWENLIAGNDCLSSVPATRWHDTTTRAGFIDHVDQFDPLLFNIAPDEAHYLDPQVRLLLQMTWRTLEKAGYSKTRLRTVQEQLGQKVGLFVGCMYQHYHLLAEDEETKAILSLQSYSSLANRVSHFFDLRGPSVAVDTACSSSLVALHMAAESIRRGECDMAVVGGVNLTLHPSKLVGLRQMGLASQKGESRGFGDGDGFVPAEGVGAVVLKRKSLAEKDADSILCVIRGSAVNHSGHTSAYSVPNGRRQVDLIADALANADVDPRTLSYVEAAANGSSLADSMEIDALTTAFRRFTSDSHFCAIGTVKSNLGHCEAVSGMSQLSKVVLQMQRGEIAPTINARPLNPLIAFENTPFVLQEEARAWQRPQIEVDGVYQTVPRRAGIGSFGAGGTNAYIVLEEYEQPTDPAPDTTEPLLIGLSARTPEQLRDVARQLRVFLDRPILPTLHDIAFTLLGRREAMPSRFAVVVQSHAELATALDHFLDEQADDGRFYVGNTRQQDRLLTLCRVDDLGRLATQWLADGLLDKVAQLWVQSDLFDITLLPQMADGRCVDLPTYPFAAQSYWLTADQPVTVINPPERPAPSIDPSADVAVEDHIMTALGDIMRLPTTQIDPNRNLHEYGFNSLYAARLTHRLSEVFQHKLSLKTMMRHRSVAEISHWLSDITVGSPSIDVLEALADGAMTVDEALQHVPH